MTGERLAPRLRTIALCESTTPAEAMAALIGAACSIGMAQFTAQQVSAMLILGIDAACKSVTPPAEGQTH